MILAGGWTRTWKPPSPSDEWTCTDEKTMTWKPPSATTEDDVMDPDGWTCTYGDGLPHIMIEDGKNDLATGSDCKVGTTSNAGTTNNDGTTSGLKRKSDDQPILESNKMRRPDSMETVADFWL